ncbi:MAG: sugar phosphate isomerase/epimerase family protein [Candidatus Asgardarchaeia archaeon]
MKQLGMTTWVSHEYNLFDFIAIAAKLGFSYIEIKTEYPLALPVLIDESTRKRVRQLLDTFNIQPLVHASYYDVNISSLNPVMRKASVKAIIESIKFAYDIGAEIVTLHPGNLPSDYSPERYLEKAQESLRESLFEIIKAASEYSVIIGLENKQKAKNHQIIWTPNDHLLFLEGMSSKWLKATFDIGHAFTVGNDLIYYLKQIYLYLVNIHVHDNDGEHDLHLVPGTGKINFIEFIAELKKLNYSGPIIIEVKSVDGLQKAKLYLNSLGLQ